MSRFNVGDRVVSTANHPDGNEEIVVGTPGTVCVPGTRVGVCWDEATPKGHNLNGRCKDGHGWWVFEDQLELEPDNGEPFEFDEEEFNKLLLAQ